MTEQKHTPGRFLVDPRIEERARELCEADGRNPDGVDWAGDPDVINGTYSWEIWREYEEEAAVQIAAEEGPDERSAPEEMRLSSPYLRQLASRARATGESSNE